jgi:hypothetical protein
MPLAMKDWFFVIGMATMVVRSDTFSLAMKYIGAPSNDLR